MVSLVGVLLPAQVRDGEARSIDYQNRHLSHAKLRNQTLGGSCASRPVGRSSIRAIEKREP